MATKLAPVHPGEVLMEEFLEPMGLSQYRVANDFPKDRARRFR
jgi:plasmid maintenance system antidote protein VapI